MTFLGGDMDANRMPHRPQAIVACNLVVIDWAEIK